MMNLKGLFIAFFALIFWTDTYSKGNPEDFSPFENLVQYYEPILKTTPAIANAGEDLSKEKINGLFSELVTELRVELNDDVLSYIRHYTTGQKKNFEVALSLEGLYAGEILRQLKTVGLPRELAFLPIALTGMHNQAVTPNNGTGIWGLNYYTAVQKGLIITPYMDERKDPAKATEVSLMYLKELYDQYKSWNLAITAFATSKGLVNKAIIASGNKINYWDIAPHLPTEARNIIPSFFASVYLASFYPEHDMSPPGLRIGNVRERLKLTDTVSINVLAKKLDVSEQTLLLMNPTFRGELILPSDSSGRDFWVPDGFTYQLAMVEKDLYTETKKESEPKKIIPKKPAVVIPEGKVKMVYVVQSGDYLGKIAEKHGVRVSYIKRWNYMRSDRINIGQKLTIYVNPSIAARNKPTPQKPSNSTTIVNIPQDRLMNYTIKEGDTLWEISRNHPGNDIETILKINGISPSIKPGQVIKIIKQ